MKPAETSRVICSLTGELRPVSKQRTKTTGQVAGWWLVDGRRTVNCNVLREYIVRFGSTVETRASALLGVNNVIPVWPHKPNNDRQTRETHRRLSRSCARHPSDRVTSPFRSLGQVVLHPTPIAAAGRRVRRPGFDDTRRGRGVRARYDRRRRCGRRRGQRNPWVETVKDLFRAVEVDDGLDDVFRGAPDTVRRDDPFQLG